MKLFKADSVENNIKRDFETKKKIELSLTKKEKEVSAQKEGMSQIDEDFWNNYGIWFMINDDFSNSEKIYRRLLELEQNLNQKGAKLHTGLPLYNMGIAQIKQKNYDEGIQNILKAYEEDISTFGLDKARGMLAFKLKEGLSEFISKVVDNNYLPTFNTLFSPKVKSTTDLIQNMEEVEELLFVKTINSAKSLTFHDDIYTKIVLFDNLKTLSMLIEYNIRRRSNKKIHLSDAWQVFPKEKWATRMKAEKPLTSYVDIPDFESKIDAIQKLPSIGNASDDFFLRSFLIAALIRNFTAHYLDEKLKILSSSKEYKIVFDHVVLALLYTLAEKI